MEIIGVILLMIGAWMIYVFNAIVSSSNQVLEASSGVDVALSKRYNLIPNLVETVKGYASHERAIFEQVAALRTIPVTNRAVYDQDVVAVQSQLLALAESYPELKADQQFLNLQRGLTDAEEHIQAARRLYNHKVEALNSTIDTFPGNLVNLLAKRERAAFFEAESQNRNNPHINW